MENAFYVEPDGIAGGLALWWSSDVKLSVLQYDKNFIDTLISVNGESEWFGTFIYAPPYEGEKQSFWERMTMLRSDVNTEWCIIGDSNIVASPNDKSGGSPFDHSNAKWYYDFLECTYLIEMQSKGGNYTWSNHRSDEDTIWEKLDRVLRSLEWNFLFPRAISIVEAAIASDHAPILLLTNGLEKRAKKDFKFESKWLLEEECPRIVTEEWASTSDRSLRGSFRVKLRRTRVKLTSTLKFITVARYLLDPPLTERWSRPSRRKSGIFVEQKA
ncbi:hypothetical protein V6N12_055232 [Hibiscus sabdariffa]|uniref:Endonuclease/exonuclease/phosphatase domain-containing protein n=1 Tax=Hibiscus sabdariffa TaxID=183260 RepID=A0ABR2BMM8_9ROSI